jgi:hypothetical protein
MKPKLIKGDAAEKLSSAVSETFPSRKEKDQ